MTYRNRPLAFLLCLVGVLTMPTVCQARKTMARPTVKRPDLLNPGPSRKTGSVMVHRRDARQRRAQLWAV